MSMNDVTKFLAVTLCLGLGSVAYAQEAATPAPAADGTTVAPATETPAATDAPAATDVPADAVSMGQEVGAAPTDGPGSVYVKSTHDDWELRCVKAADGSDPCQLYQLLKDEKGNSVAEISLFALPAGGPAVAGANIIAPLETLLTQQLQIQIDTSKAKVYPFTWCDRGGCVARIGFTAEEVAALKAGNKATVTIVPAAAPDQRVALNLSLKGFTAGFDAVAATAAK